MQPVYKVEPLVPFLKEQNRISDTNLTRSDKHVIDNDTQIIGQESNGVNKNQTKIMKVRTLNPYKDVPTLHFKLNGQPPPAQIFKVIRNANHNKIKRIPDSLDLFAQKRHKVRAQIQQKNINTNDAKDIYCVDLKKIKKDALYKPLLRKFRNFLRKHMDTFQLLKGYLYWPIQRLRSQVWKYMKEIQLPKEFMTSKYHVMISLILFPTIANK